jgi:hypothetical protein
MAEGLPVSRVVDVDVNFAPVAAPAAAFDTLLIMGDSDVLTAGEGIRAYEAMEQVAEDFQATDPEFRAAQLYFSQTPQPNTLFIGRWARTPSAGVLIGGPLTNAEQQMASWNAITAGAFKIAVNGGAPLDVTGLNFGGDGNLNAIAAKIDTAWAGGTVVWDEIRDRFVFESSTTGPTSAVSFLSAPTAGTDISAKLRGTASTAERSSAGVATETDPLQAVIRVDGLGWYALVFATATPITDDNHLAISGYIESTNEKHLYGITTNSAIVLDPAQTIDVATQAAAADYTRTMVQYSIYHPHAIASIFGRAFSTNFEGSNTTITLKFKREPGVSPEFLTTTQANTLMAKRCNVYIGYNNDTSIYQEGVMSGPAYFDEIHGLDWLANRIQNDLWNLLYQSPKVPQTDSGIHGMLTRCESSLNQGVTNGLIAPGVWNAPGFGILYDGAYLEKGWYSYADSVDNQSQSIREQRIAPLIQIAVKMAGAVHFASVLINVNR